MPQSYPGVKKGKRQERGKGKNPQSVKLREDSVKDPVKVNNFMKSRAKTKKMKKIIKNTKYIET